MIQLLLQFLEHPNALFRGFDALLENLRLSSIGKYPDSLKTLLVGVDTLKWFGIAAAFRIAGTIEKLPRNILRVGLGFCIFFGSWDALRAISVNETYIPWVSGIFGALAFVWGIKRDEAEVLIRPKPYTGGQDKGDL
jgi:hypothetical protein